MARGAEMKEIEEFPKRLRIFFYVLVILLIFGTVGFRIISEESLTSSLSRTTHTLAFIFNDDSTVSERFMEITLAIVGVFLVWWVLWSSADLILDGSLRKYLKRRKYISSIRTMKNHIIIVGGGRVGEEIARVLALKKKSFLIVESDYSVVSLLRKNGYQTEDYTYLLFYHPHQVEENGHVCFNTDLVKIKVDIKNAEKIFKKAIEVLENDIPAPSDECGFCKWSDIT